MTRELVALAVSAPLMVAGLAGAAVAQSWPPRLGGAAMVIGAAIALAVTDRRARWLAWGLAGVGALVLLISWI